MENSNQSKVINGPRKGQSGIIVGVRSVKRRGDDLHDEAYLVAFPDGCTEIVDMSDIEGGVIEDGRLPRAVVDPKTKAVYVHLKDLNPGQKVSHTVTLYDTGPTIIIDYKDGTVVGVEIIP